MNKKIDTQELDIPEDDINCWSRYPKHRWVYEMSRLLDSQNIKWSPFEIDELSDLELNIKLFTNKIILRRPGFIYVKRPEGSHLFTEVYIIKGEIKLMRHVELRSQTETLALNGEVELRINAFITLYFQKFTGVLGIETYSNEIHRIQLRSYLDIISELNQDVIKLTKRIYKKIS